MSDAPIALAVHGGAGRLAKPKTRYPQRLPYEIALGQALYEGQKILQRGGTALRAVVAAVCVLEDCDLFNAGQGAALCADGSVELSASVMNGKGRKAGAVASAALIRNPIKGAEAVIKSPHVVLAGEAADTYAREAGLAMEPQDYFKVPARIEQWEAIRDTGKVVLDHSDGANGTVGAVARDKRGNLAAATSTGGLVNQWPGRIGDSPIIGAGTWADNPVCAVSATGKGDPFARVAFARRVADLMELKRMGPEAAGKAALLEVRAVGGTGGCIIVDAKGRVALPFDSAQMLRGWVRGNDVPRVAILPGEAVEVRLAD